MLAPALLAIAIAASGAAMWGEAGAHAAGSAAGADTAAFGPTFEAIDLAIDPRTETWSGSLEADVSVRREARRMLLRLAGPVVNRVSLSDSSGRISTVFAQRGAELLLIEAAHALAPGKVHLLVAFDGRRAGAPPGISGPPGGPLTLARGAGAVFPAWGAGAMRTRCRLVLHVPVPFRVTTKLQLRERSVDRGWSSSVYEPRVAIDPDSLRVTIRR